MPPEDKEETSELEELRNQLAQRDAQMNLVLQEKAALEELVMNGPALAELARQSNAGKEKTEERVEEKRDTNNRDQNVDPKKLAEATIATATRTAEEVTKNAIAANRQKEVATDLFQKDPVFRLYIEEIKHFARIHPTLSVQQAYDMAKKEYPDKEKAAATKEKDAAREREVNVGRIRDSREPDSRNRFSGVPKAKNPEDRDTYRQDRFDTAIEAGLKAAGFDV